MSSPSSIPAGSILPAEALLQGEAVTVVAPAADRKAAQLNEKASVADEEEWTYPDGGLRAWLVVFGCALMTATCMGWGLVWGVLQDFYHSDQYKDASLSTLSLVGGLFSFSMNSTAYFFGGIGERYGFKRMIALSSLLSYLCLLASAFATKLYQVFLFQGCLLGISGGISMPLYMALPAQWFQRRRGLATGIAVSGSSLGGAAGSLVIRPLLSNLGYKKTMLVYSAIYAVIWICAWFMMAERRAPGYEKIQKHWLPTTRGPAFYCVALTVFTGIFGFQGPYYLITTYVKVKVPSLDPNSLLVVVPLVIMNIGGGIGRIMAGRLADAFGTLNMFFTTFLLGGLAQLLIWMFADTFGSIIAFSLVYGLVGCWFISLLPVVCAQLFGLNDLATITGFMILANSPGQLAGASIGGAVLSRSGNNWQAVAAYSGCAMLLGSCFALSARLSHERRIFVKV
ncbi:unnamed protein product [Mycena citricolor]|uniref:Major facilitator superfamily (MFS) profile domain-containing protein n=1 Tax=Mycena citricolor TaxID=2018698 RepID=A0AAD2K5P0_9AGAR|nr:unnamed protein product [Mycena citricolor]CAK5278636.1 unnamed protein product [Mycena citricolor]